MGWVVKSCKGHVGKKMGIEERLDMSLAMRSVRAYDEPRDTHFADLTFAIFCEMGYAA